MSDQFPEIESGLPDDGYVQRSGLWVPAPQEHPAAMTREQLEAQTGLSLDEIFSFLHTLTIAAGHSGAFDDAPEAYGHELYDQCKALGDDIHDNGIENTIYLDASARPGHVGVRQYMRLRYPNEPLPKTYFINPEAAVGAKERPEYEDRRALALKVLRHKFYDETPKRRAFGSALRRFGMRSLVSSTENLLNQSRARYPIDVEVAAQLVIDQPELAERAQKPTMIIDTCAHTGESMALTKRVLKAVGFHSVRTAVVDGSRRLHGASDVDFATLQGDPERPCHPFGLETSIQKDPQRLVGQRTRNAADLKRGRENREAIRRTIIEFAQQDPDIPVR